MSDRRPEELGGSGAYRDARTRLRKAGFPLGVRLAILRRAAAEGTPFNLVGRGDPLIDTINVSAVEQQRRIQREAEAGEQAAAELMSMSRPSFVSENWPYLALGGAAIAGLLIWRYRK